MTWYLVMVATGLYIGPIDQSSCIRAEAAILDPAIVCREARVMQACEVPNQPASYRACPVFDFPRVTVKPSN